MDNGNGANSLIILALPLLLLGWMFWSANRRTKQMRQFNSSLNVGDQVVTSSGIFGTIRHLDDISAHLEVADGLIMRFDRRAVAMKQADVTAPQPARPQSDDSSEPGQ
ncbi:preprotein translocase subunit YajC [Intrasporangium calvum]|uniref:Preprotein translocase, YajC subunit n=1 Tax=Intrasporangium calvum (strain ATCC 23552 / DSM 43043 / JCM 3097 / NBRC 12989 / NCIMB 10167 / NRRL B-3866 / 7 KIP) TaxID=710696 RepID=E6SB78_INTC7|nr:preprotein translocase subunit YajC [Intrasporangium calvum]ADU48366.1 preprotein translocase, YajC subunit [Intrasporangium calvum DSM 43043]AXG13401.1 preprotein translocase subunit YajC [Intrasporangium calvum]